MSTISAMKFLKAKVNLVFRVRRVTSYVLCLTIMKFGLLAKKSAISLALTVDKTLKTKMSLTLGANRAPVSTVSAPSATIRLAKAKKDILQPKSKNVLKDTQ